VGKDARMLGIRSWWATAMNWEEWRKLLREAKTLYELQCRWLSKLHNGSFIICTLYQILLEWWNQGASYVGNMKQMLGRSEMHTKYVNKTWKERTTWDTYAKNWI
jgi:hypothetical protein